MTNLEYLMLTQCVAIGQVSTSFTGEKAPVVYFATLTAGGNTGIVEGLQKGYWERAGSDLAAFEVGCKYDKSIYPLLLESAWFPMSTAPTPQAALVNLIEKMNKPEIREMTHLLKILVEKTKKRWIAMDLADADTGKFEFHLDPKRVVPEKDKWN